MTPYRLLILVFSLFACSQFISGFVLYAYKAGLDYPSSLSYYKGTKEAEKILGRSLGRRLKQNFLQQKRSFYTLLETACAHAAAYALLIFVVAHFLRSLSNNAAWSGWISFSLFSLAFLDILSVFGARYGPPFFSAARLLVLCVFIFCGFTASLALFCLACFQDKIKIPNQQKNLSG